MGQQSRSSLEQVCQLNVEVLGEPGGCAGGGGGGGRSSAAEELSCRDAPASAGEA